MVVHQKQYIHFCSGRIPPWRGWQDNFTNCFTSSPSLPLAPHQQCFIRIKDQDQGSGLRIKDQRSRVRGEKKQVTPICPQLMVFSSFLLLEPFPLCEAFSIWLSLKRIAWGFEYIGISLLEGFLTCICICHLSVWTFPDLPNKYILQSEQIYFDIWAKTFKYRFLRNLSGLSNRVFIYSMDYFRRVRFQFFKLPVVHHTP